MMQLLSVKTLALMALLCASVTAFADSKAVTDSVSEGAAVTALDVYKSRTCGCCEKWVSHVESLGLDIALHHPIDMNRLKRRKGIAPRYQSCHTAVSNNGYVFEGHVPADVIQRFLAAPPKNALGLAVPGMPIGSPGMEQGNRRDSYNVLLLMKDGRAAIYERIEGNR